MKLVKPDAKCSPVKKSKFKLLIQSWENSSNQILTPVVSKPPRSTAETGSKSEKTFENVRKICPGVSSAIGQENLVKGHPFDTEQ